MELTRSPVQGVWNIVRFNWHFYVLAGIILMVLFVLKRFLPESLQPWILLAVGTALFTMLISLLVSYYIYDLSGLYQLNWLKKNDGLKILNISAGFDETSAIIQQKYPEIELTIADFYDPEKHTEVSIERAQKMYPPSSETIRVQTTELPFSENQFDQTLAILSAHEIREEAERIQFFGELRRVTQPAGKIYVMEHLRDTHNFLAYTVGFLHFHSRKTWLRTFQNAGLPVEKEIKITPFVTLFILSPNGNTP